MRELLLLLLLLWFLWRRERHLRLERGRDSFLFGERESGEEKWKTVEMSEEAAAISFSVASRSSFS